MLCGGELNWVMALTRGLEVDRCDSSNSYNLFGRLKVHAVSGVFVRLCRIGTG